MTTHSLLIDGQHVSSSSGDLMDVINPATEEVIAQVPSATDADVDSGGGQRACGARGAVGRSVGA